METYWLRVALVVKWKYLTNENLRLSKLLMKAKKVIFFGVFNKLFLTSYFHYLPLGWIYCVRWSPSGDMIATASHDSAASLWNFKTGKVLYTGYSADESNCYLLQKWNAILTQFLDTSNSVCFIWARNKFNHHMKRRPWWEITRRIAVSQNQEHLELLFTLIIICLPSITRFYHACIFLAEIKVLKNGK